MKSQVRRLFCLSIFGSKIGFIMVILIFSGVDLTKGDELLKQKFLDEYRKESKLIAEKLSKVRGKFHVIREERNSEADYEFHFDHGFEKVHSFTSGNTKGIKFNLEKIECFGNGDYFRLERSKDSEPFQLKSIGGSFMDVNIYLNYTGRILMAPLGARPILLQDVMKLKHFELIDVNRISPKEEYLEVRFKYGTSSPKVESIIVLDPSNHWSIISQETTSWTKRGNAYIEKLNVKYGDTVDGLRMPKTVTIEREGRMGPEINFTEWRFEGTPESEFKLSHYNLPDLIQNRKNNSSFRFYVRLAIASLFIMLIFYLLRKYRRSSIAIS